MSACNGREPLSIAIDVPGGYVALPLTDIAGSVSRAESVFAEIGPGPVSSAAPAVLQALKVLLTRATQLNAVYCGLGRHSAADGQTISSTLIVSVHEYGERKNPRLALADVLTARTSDGGTFENIEMIQVSGRPILLLDRVRELPAPDFPDRTSESAVAKVYQLEAVVSATDGTAIAAVECSTSSVEYGEEFVPMIAAMAASVEFVTSAASSRAPSSLDL
ncbi:hypothetical protein DFR70_103178 [Nocardia tenerifensis]|uniref:Uncharacterized protein n=1 Tax=Nocardia tenerifensis TaxID=228006 RepID=A0A318K4T5_9NOCA|nr:hypothetical protein DFR70_103178 [Nocardia tenerifensis]